MQAKIAQEMISPPAGANSILQLNMGEGKSSVSCSHCGRSSSRWKEACASCSPRTIVQPNVPGAAQDARGHGWETHLPYANFTIGLYRLAQGEADPEYVRGMYVCWRYPSHTARKPPFL